MLCLIGCQSHLIVYMRSLFPSWLTVACLLLVGFDGCNATSVIKADQASRTVTRRENLDLGGEQLQLEYVLSTLSIRQ